MKSDDLDLLLGLGKVLSDIAKILKEQSRSKTKRSLSTEIERTRALAQRHIKVSKPVFSDRGSVVNFLKKTRSAAGSAPSRQHKSRYSGRICHHPCRPFP